jgi:hypothetical protein
MPAQILVVIQALFLSLFEINRVNRQLDPKPVLVLFPVRSVSKTPK